MEISVNEEPVEVSIQSNITSLLSQVGLPSVSGVAVAVNSRIIKKEEWEKYSLSENDQVLIIRATQGG